MIRGSYSFYNETAERVRNEYNRYVACSIFVAIIWPHYCCFMNKIACNAINAIVLAWLEEERYRGIIAVRVKTGFRDVLRQKIVWPKYLFLFRFLFVWFEDRRKFVGQSIVLFCIVSTMAIPCSDCPGAMSASAQTMYEDYASNYQTCISIRRIADALLYHRGIAGVEHMAPKFPPGHVVRALGVVRTFHRASRQNL